MEDRLLNALLLATAISLLVLFWGTRKFYGLYINQEEQKERVKKTKQSFIYVWQITFAIFMFLSGFATL